jgi:hypothetical protein
VSFVALLASAMAMAAPSSAAEPSFSLEYPLTAPFAGDTQDKAATPQVQIGPAYVYTHTHQEYSDGYCSGGGAGYIRFAAIRGVTSLTVVFNDAAYGGAEQRVPVSADAEGNWTQDHPEGSDTYPDLVPPKGEHQIGWTGYAYFGPGECQPDNADYSGRMTNAHTEYYREGSYIDGQVTGPCEDGTCPPVKGVKVTARGSGGGSDTTTESGRYSIKVNKGNFTVTPKKGDLGFSPRSKKVSVGTNKTGRADFTVGGGPAKLAVEVVPKQSPINVSDSPEQDGPARTTVAVTVRNSGKDTATGVTLKDLGIEWDVEDVKAPDPLPLKQVGPPSAAELGDIEPDQAVTSEFLVEATGDGTFKLTAQAAGQDTSGKSIKGTGKAKIKAESPLLFIYTRPEQSVSSPDAPELIKAGTALSMRVRLWNRSYKETLAVLPFTVGLEGNLVGGYLQKAGLPIQNGPDIKDIDVVYKANNVVVLEPRESRLLDAVFRTTYSDPTSSEGGGGTRGAATFPKPDTRLYDPETGKLKPVAPEDVAFSAGSEHHEFSIDDRAPEAPPSGGWLDTDVTFGAFTKGALTGLAYSIVGTIKSIPDLLKLVGTGGQAYLQLLAQREAELWQAVRESDDAHEAFDHYVQKQFEFMLRDFEAVGKVPGALKNALDGFDKSSQQHLNKLANRWFAGDWLGAAEELGQDTGQIAGDVGLGDVVLAKALAALPRLGKVVKAANKSRAAVLEKLAPAVERFTAKAQPAVRAMKFIAHKLEPGFVPDFEALQVLYGLSRTQSKFLASLARARGVLIAVRSRGAGALDWIDRFKAWVKPEWIKIKNVNEYDIEFLNYLESDLDRVVINRNLPDEAQLAERLDAAGVTDPEVRREVFERLKTRQDELATDEPGFVKWIEAQAASGDEYTSNFNWADNGLDPAAKGRSSKARFIIADEPPPGNLMVSVDGSPPRPVTGDVDLVAITKADGTPLTDELHEELLRILAGPPMYIQHPETATWIKQGAFDFAKKHAELLKDLPVQFGADGVGRVVRYIQDQSFFKSTHDYFVQWEGGYRHLDWLKMPGLTGARP